MEQNHYKVNFASREDVPSFAEALKRRVTPWQRVLSFDARDPDQAGPSIPTRAPSAQVGFGLKCETWRAHWTEDYESEDLMPGHNLRVTFARPADRREFMRRLGLPEDRVKNTWWPVRPYGKHSADPESSAAEQGRFPVYVISKGRAAQSQTHRALRDLGVKHKVVIEPQEEAEYARRLGERHLLVLPFSNLGKGSIPARNWVWEHALKIGAERHWILDDNINGFYSCNRNLKRRERKLNPLERMEDFVLRYSNVGLAGPQYEFFVPRNERRPPYVLNTRVYSCILIDNSLPFRWRGRYNEDTDLSLRVLEAGLCTVLFNRWLIKKAPTMTMRGGNTDELYKGAGRLKMARSLQRQHPRRVKVTFRWGRPQHLVDYRPFKRNKLLFFSGKRK